MEEDLAEWERTWTRSNKIPFTDKENNNPGPDPFSLDCGLVFIQKKIKPIKKKRKNKS